MEREIPLHAPLSRHLYTWARQRSRDYDQPMSLVGTYRFIGSRTESDEAVGKTGRMELRQVEHHKPVYGLNFQL